MLIGAIASGDALRRTQWYPHLTRVQVPVDYEDVRDDFINPRMMCQLSPSEVLIVIMCS